MIILSDATFGADFRKCSILSHHKPHTIQRIILSIRYHSEKFSHRHLESFSWVESTLCTQHTQHKNLNIARQILGLSTNDSHSVRQTPLGLFVSISAESFHMAANRNGNGFKTFRPFFRSREFIYHLIIIYPQISCK